MAKSQQTFGKKEKEKKRLQKRKEKQQKLEERKANPKSSKLDDMIAYVDEFGNISDTPPDPTKKKKINAETIEISIPKQEHVEEDPIKKGRVDFFDSSKGFGFIIEQDTKERFFVHVNGLTEEVVEGNQVSFELEQGLKGLNAVRVKKI
ncbi:cold-shock protein [Carboxylicivirga sp. M1479]|uniref:cold-shock protein n=1 Tax=Carboxylicivirga sp. M1479 TaxID=2594476 RepID=UPI0011773B3C|nr:cold shock domain-containing protein [Carboxylicivirga sp. M1479]TRX71249.1 cold shock domain-containing protein [Carboxylicivirga sp. M1479]